MNRRGVVDGVLLLDKPVGPTSNAVLGRTKWLLNALKAGHGGTLDPMASGLMVLLFGEATKFAGWLLHGTKQYSGRIQLGSTTTTGDREGDVLQRKAVDAASIDIDALCARFVGDIDQIPPIYSALKRDGRPLYEYARKGEVVDIAPRRVRIESLDIAFEPPDILVFRTRCSGGTYIRSLAQDLGAQIGCGAHLAELRREGSGALTLDDAVSLDLLENLPPEERQRYLLPTDLPIMALPRLELQADAATGLRQGRELFVSTPSACGESRAYGPGDQFLGVVTVEPGGRVKALRLLATQPAMDGRP